MDPYRIRWPRRGLLSAAAGVALAFAAVTGTPAAAHQQLPELPEPGKPISLTISVDGLELRFGDLTVNTGALKGTLSVVPAVNPDDPNSMIMHLAAFHMSTPIGAAAKQPGGLGDVELYVSAADPTDIALLKLIPSTPPKFEHAVVLPLRLQIEKSPVNGVAREPLVLTTKDPARLIGNLTQFPPRGDLYKLQNPVDLVLPDDPDVTIATIEKFPVKVGGL